MGISLFIARRYLLAKKSRSIINLISWISVIGVAVGTMALVTVLSVFNGFESLIVSLYNSFDPDIRICLNEGKRFDPADLPTDKISRIPGVQYCTPALEEKALLRYRDRQYIASIRGITSDPRRVSLLEHKMIDGHFVLQQGDTAFAVIGNGVAYYLSVDLNDPTAALNVYVPDRAMEFSMDAEKAFHHQPVAISGVFSIQQDFDEKYVLLPIDFARSLLGYEKEVSEMEIGLSPGANAERIQEEIASLSGKHFNVQNRYQQHEMLYKILKTEKWAVYFILTFILLIAIFNITGSLSMLIIEKKQDILVLSSLGAGKNSIRRIFLLEGIMISLVGAFSGLLLGWVLCILQQQFGFVKLNAGEGSFVIDAYPVDMQALDFIYVFFTVFAIGLLASWFPVRQMVKSEGWMSKAPESGF